MNTSTLKLILKELEVKIDVVCCNNTITQGCDELTSNLLKTWSVLHVLVGDSVDFSCGHRPHWINEGVQDKTRLLPRLATNDRHFDHAILTWCGVSSTTALPEHKS